MITTIPVEPDADTARDWAIDELADPRYADQGQSWVERLLEWLNTLFEGLDSPGGSLPSANALLIVLAILAVVAVVVWLVMGPLRRARQGKRTHSVFDDDTRTAAQMRSAAEVAAGNGDWATAVIEMYRVTVRSLEERDILADKPGTTAYEAAIDTGIVFPDVAAAMAADADVFDGLRYGHFVASEHHYRHAVATFRSLEGRSLLQGSRS